MNSLERKGPVEQTKESLSQVCGQVLFIFTQPDYLTMTAAL